MKERITITLDSELVKALNFLKKKKEKSAFINMLIKDFLLNADKNKKLQYFSSEDLKIIDFILKHEKIKDIDSKTLTLQSNNTNENNEEDFIEIDDTKNISKDVGESDSIKIEKRF